MPKAKKETTKKSVKTVKKTTLKKPKTIASKKSVKQIKTVKATKSSKPAKVAKTSQKEEPKVKRTRKSSKQDTGSVDFQIDNFSQKIKLLAKHLKTHTHDFDSRRGLLIMVGKRRKLLNYLKKTDLKRYEEVTKSLKLKV